MAATRKAASCHPNKPHEALGLCKSCYTKHWMSSGNPKAVARKRESSKARAHLWYQHNKALALTKNAAYKYGISLDEVKRLRETPCMVCGSCEKVQIDHDHTTSEVRGSLCATCNSVLGFAETSDLKLSELFKRILKYVGKGPNG